MFFFLQNGFNLHSNLNCDISAEWHIILSQYLIYGFPIRNRPAALFVPSNTMFDFYQTKSLLGWSQMTIGICIPSTVCVFDFAIDCLWHFVQRGTTSVQIAHFIQHETMTESDTRPAQKHTDAHYPNQSVWQSLLGIIGEGKKREEKINRPAATLKEMLLQRHMPFPHVHCCFFSKT